MLIWFSGLLISGKLGSVISSLQLIKKQIEHSKAEINFIHQV